MITMMNQKTRLVPSSALLRMLTKIDQAERQVHEYFKDEPHRIYYRGVKDYEYRLVAGLLREMKDDAGSVVADSLLKYELEIVESVEREYPVELRGLTFVEKLVWMQHYGFPTRLLDVTRNKLVALYFAVTGSCKEKDGALYVVGIPESQVVQAKDVSEERLGEYNPTLLLSPALTERQRRQHGEFLLMGDKQYAWYDEKRCGSKVCDCVSDGGIVIEGKKVSVADKVAIREELSRGWGITTHFLFPEDPCAYRDELVDSFLKKL